MTARLTAPTAPGPIRRASTLGTARYEYLMQVRRPATWVVSAALIAAAAAGPGRLGGHVPLPDLTASWAETFNLFAPLGVGILLADRARRETRLGLDDLLESAPAGVGPRWWGKAAGATAAAITPIFCGWIALLIDLAVRHGPAVLPVGLAAFAAVALPGLIFVAACSLAVPLLTGPALYRAGFIGYWFWGNLLNSRRLPIPTLAGTPFEPIGEYASGGWFGGKVFEAPNRGIHPDAALAAVSVTYLIVAALAALAAAQLVLTRRNQT